ncbi:unnamed protein product [Rangifer tarandus platyrhynchus]|uniref:Uncharacterized protein n=2 Tax=Rangifer tarandus platyrhynchus TaxID=3082113 RepID=A0ABN8YTK4_RANTA|nr:unnamed protein product [Rangifer tarandus platyrhynchus]CAI9702485.1 unnamed protein product [Rangifer tarandus platyrhynchus]
MPRSEAQKAGLLLEGAGGMMLMLNVTRRLWQLPQLPEYLGLRDANLWLQDDKLQLRGLCGFLDAADRHKAGSARPVAALWAPRCLCLRHEVAPRGSEAAGTRGARGGTSGREPGAHGALLLLLLLPLDQEKRGRGRRHRLPQIEGLRAGLSGP